MVSTRRSPSAKRRSSIISMGASRIHLIVLIHGLYGNPDNLAVVKEELERASPSSRRDKGKGKAREVDDESEVEALLDGAGSSDDRLEVQVLVCKSFTGSHTWDGIDVNAHKAAKEIDDEIKRLRKEGKVVEVFSLMGYSLGGLVGRYLVGVLHARSPSFFEMHRPGSFSTFATPHIGTLRYGSRVNTIVHTVGRRLFSRSGRQLYRYDHVGESERPVLSVLADPGYIFFEALRLFPRIKIVANGCNDLTVPYPTGSISLTDPFVDHLTNNIDIHVDEKHCVTDYSFPTASSEVEERRKRRLGEFERDRHRLPPFFVLPLPGPLKHLTILLLPFILPLAIIYATITLMLHTWQSTKRLRHHHKSTSGMGERTPLRSRSTSGSDTPTSTPTLTSKTKTKTTSKEDIETVPNRIPLLLDDEQVEMIHHLNSIPQLEKVITWWPWCWNTHAMLVVRSAKRFKFQEAGRKVVRDWAEWAIEIGNQAGDN